MSLKTWKAEFYPKPASRVAKKEALAHSLQKWKGLTKAALKRHGVVKAGWEIIDGKDSFTISAASCALCVHHLNTSVFAQSPDRCGECPLAAVRRGVACDIRAVGESHGPYQYFINACDARPMIRALQKAVRDANR